MVKLLFHGCLQWNWAHFRYQCSLKLNFTFFFSPSFSRDILHFWAVGWSGRHFISQRSYGPFLRQCDMKDVNILTKWVSILCHFIVSLSWEATQTLMHPSQRFRYKCYWTLLIHTVILFNAHSSCINIYKNIFFFIANTRRALVTVKTAFLSSRQRKWIALLHISTEL